MPGRAGDGCGAPSYEGRPASSFAASPKRREPRLRDSFAERQNAAVQFGSPDHGSRSVRHTAARLTARASEPSAFNLLASAFARAT
jgi:hypothetical protein